MEIPEHDHDHFLYGCDMDAGGISYVFRKGWKPPNATSFQDNKIDKLEEVFRDVRFQSAFSKDVTMIVRTCRLLVGFWQALARKNWSASWISQNDIRSLDNTRTD